MRWTFVANVALCLMVSAAAQAQTELKILPPEIVLTGRNATQRLLAEEVSAGVCVADRTEQAVFSSSNPKALLVTKDGVLIAKSDGEATIIAKVGARIAKTKVRATQTQKPIAWSFRNHILPALTKASCNSGACHGAAAGKGGLKLTLRGYDAEADHAALTRQASARRVVVDAPQSSLLLQKPSSEIPHGGGKRIPKDSADYLMIAEWIRAGAPRPSEAEPKPLRLEVFPKSARLSEAGAKQRILVRARYSDGHTEDVTRWVKFGTSESSVALSDDFGQVKMTGKGDAAITVWFSSQVAFARMMAPFPNQVPENRYAEAMPKRNAIDEVAIAKLRALQIPPSPTCSDNEFIRRAYLDSCGVLPTPQEVGAFLSDAADNKRARLIDRLLERPEFVDYWTYKWSDLLLVSSRKLPGGSLASFSGWIRKSVAENKPWNQFARELLTAQGSTLENGAANYFLLHKDPIDLTETTTQAFLGMSLTCARCHNHPMEKWTQRDYYQMANLFARVRLKNGERAGDVLALASTEGDINHPRLGVPLPPRPLDGKTLRLAATEDRRIALADWITAPENPYFAKAIINRVWRNYMGRGLVESEDDLRLTNPPSNPELLDRLEKDFIRSGYDLKALMRSIMNAAIYQRSSAPVAGNEKDDRYYSRYLSRRLSAEVILDALSQVTGIPTEFEGYAKGTRALQLPDTQIASYFLTAFGRPERAQTCSCERQQEPSVAQALHLANGDTVNQKLKASGGVLDRFVKGDMRFQEMVDQAYLLALSRPPATAEKERILEVMRSHLGATSNEQQRIALLRAAVEDLFWAVLTGNEFLFNH